MSESVPTDPSATVVYWTPRRICIAVFLTLVAVPLAVGGGRLIRDWLDPPHAPTLKPVFDMANLTIEKDLLFPGGPSKDGIPALTDPVSVPVADADFMLDDYRVIGVTTGGESRAYPVTVLNYHEVINDVLGQMPIGVIFCPLCDSVTIVDRRIDDATLEFGTSGYLLESNVVLYDRTDDALWSQVGLEALSGPYAGRSLTHLSSWEITTFDQWRTSHPDSTVVSFATGYRRPYEQTNAYPDYFVKDHLMFPVSDSSPAFRNKEPVVGIAIGDARRAYPLITIAAQPDGELRDSLAGQEIVLRAGPGDGSIAIVKVPADAIVIHTFWFAWYAFHPETEVYGLTEVPTSQPDQ